MLYAFAFPLVGGALPATVMALASNAKCPCAAARNLYHSGIAALTVGSIIQGVLEIYGTANALTVWYWYIGGALIAFAVAIYCIQLIRNRSH